MKPWQIVIIVLACLGIAGPFIYLGIYGRPSQTVPPHVPLSCTDPNTGQMIVDCEGKTFDVGTTHMDNGTGGPTDAEKKAKLNPSPNPMVAK